MPSRPGAARPDTEELIRGSECNRLQMYLLYSLARSPFPGLHSRLERGERAIQQYIGRLRFVPVVLHHRPGTAEKLDRSLQEPRRPGFRTGEPHGCPTTIATSVNTLAALLGRLSLHEN